MKVRFTLVLACAFVLALPVVASAHPMPANTLHGSYQSGIGVLDFSDTENAREIAYADPAPLVPPQLGGDWSSYFYNGYIYESDITRGLYAWKLKDRDVRKAVKLTHLNPQTQEFTLDDRRRHRDR